MGSTHLDLAVSTERYFSILREQICRQVLFVRKPFKRHKVASKFVGIFYEANGC